MTLLDKIPKKKLAEIMKETTKKTLFGLLLDAQYEINMLKSELETIKNQSTT